jgi:hypothetical protein
MGSEVDMVENSSTSPVSQASRALLAVVDRLTAEFPEVPLSVVYEQVGEAREVAARYLPDVTMYQDALEREARTRLRFDQTGPRFEMSAGTSQPAPLVVRH